MWLNYLYKVLTEKDGVLQSTPVKCSGFLSHNQREEDVRPRATVGVFLRDMTRLPEAHPSVHEAFMAGNSSCNVATRSLH